MCFQVLNEQKAGVQKEAAELRNNLHEVEKARLEARRELQELRRQVRSYLAAGFMLHIVILPEVSENSHESP